MKFGPLILLQMSRLSCSIFIFLPISLPFLGLLLASLLRVHGGVVR